MRWTCFACYRLSISISFISISRHCYRLWLFICMRFAYMSRPTVLSLLLSLAVSMYVCNVFINAFKNKNSSRTIKLRLRKWSQMYRLVFISSFGPAFFFSFLHFYTFWIRWTTVDSRRWYDVYAFSILMALQWRCCCWVWVWVCPLQSEYENKSWIIWSHKYHCHCSRHCPMRHTHTNTNTLKQRANGSNIHRPKTVKW